MPRHVFDNWKNQHAVLWEAFNFGVRDQIKHSKCVRITNQRQPFSYLWFSNKENSDAATSWGLTRTPKEGFCRLQTVEIGALI